MAVATIKSAAFIALTLLVAARKQDVERSMDRPATSSGRECVFPGEDSILPIVVADLSDGVSSDGRGPYINNKDGVIQTRAGREGALVICLYDRKKRTCADSAEALNSVRSFTVNLSKPVPGGGGASLGTVGSRTAGAILAQRGMIGDTIQNLNTIAVGHTDAAAMLSISLRVNGRNHLLQMGPQANGHCLDASDGVPGKNLVHGTGTSTGTISRVSPTKWVIDLPQGSIGRLFDSENGPDHAVDKGLYYVHLHYEIGR